MNERAKQNAIRSMVVMVGSLAFGYLTLKLGAKPFLEKAEEFERSMQAQQSRSSQSSQEEEEDTSIRRF